MVGREVGPHLLCHVLSDGDFVLHVLCCLHPKCWTAVAACARSRIKLVSNIKGPTSCTILVLLLLLLVLRGRGRGSHEGLCSISRNNLKTCGFVQRYIYADDDDAAPTFVCIA